ncbi:glycoside hydrolase family 32 protein [Actinoplanes sp. NBRC 103695]|uniref:glycoside hydrolase family 32 protein n=1 Tax=Actinoplanes sp. NBRC 103695 TaxID=3032202 RepID=UPI0025566CDF|nr:glycoside hydrolase family 32 protein [Actinoplanes sp. NBRC 103695]
MGRLWRGAVSGVLALVVVMAAPVVPARAGTPDGYPEFPYPATSYDEPLRGQFHFSSRAGWMNDPNGSFWYRGQYHLLYQHNPHGLAWDTMHWGHATSPDLVHWTQKPIALEPGVHPGELWSGNGIVDTGNVTGLKSGDDDPILVFSGTGGAIIHYSLDGARTFQTYAAGRKVAVPNGTSRDPKVFWHAPSRRWVMVMWSDGGGNGADFFTSTNLLTWTWRSRYAAGWFFECPDMVELAIDGDPARKTWVLTDASGEYVSGDFDGTTFRPRTGVQRMDYGANDAGGTFYAGQTFTGDPQGRTVQMVWQPASRGSVWSGNLTFPAELELKGTTLTRTPVSEIASLRSGTVTAPARTLTPEAPYVTGGADAYEVSATFDTAGATATRFGLRLNGRTIAYDRAAQTLYGAPLAPDNGRVTVRALVDRGQLEIFGNDGRLSVSDVVTDFDPAAGVRAYAEGGSVRLASLRYDRLGSAWGRGEPTLDSNLGGTWAASGGAWTDDADGKLGTAAGDGFYLNSGSFQNGTYEADVRLRDAAAAGVTFRDQYTANVDVSGVVKLWRPGRVIATAPAAITRDRTYHLRVVAAGSHFQVFLDHGTTPLIDATDTGQPLSGKAGVNVFDGTAVFDNVHLNATGFRTNLTGPWTSSAGTWTSPGDGLSGRGAGDSFTYSTQRGADFTYDADVRPVNGIAAGITFRDGYTANVDVTGVVKLWRPGRDLAAYATPIVPGRWYHLTVVAAGSRLRVRLNGVQVIDATDTAYPEGRFGLNTYAGSGAFQNVRVS